MCQSIRTRSFQYQKPPALNFPPPQPKLCNSDSACHVTLKRILRCLMCVAVFICFRALARKRIEMGELRLCIINSPNNLSATFMKLYHSSTSFFFLFFCFWGHRLSEIAIPLKLFLLYAQQFQSSTQLCRAFDMLPIFQWNENNTVFSKVLGTNCSARKAMHCWAEMDAMELHRCQETRENTKWHHAFCSNSCLHTCSFAH